MTRRRFRLCLVPGVWMSLTGGMWLPSGISFAADVYRCPGPDDTIEYRNTAPSKGCVRVDTRAVLSVSAPPSVSSSKGTTRTSVTQPAAATTGAFPRVELQQQKERDNDRRQVLEAELRAEEGRRIELLTQWNNGQPERQGNERNYQRYLERVAQLRGDLDRVESNIAALRRELAALK